MVCTPNSLESRQSEVESVGVVVDRLWIDGLWYLSVGETTQLNKKEECRARMLLFIEMMISMLWSGFNISFVV
jgi:hypothetical protein